MSTMYVKKLCQKCKQSFASVRMQAAEHSDNFVVVSSLQTVGGAAGTAVAVPLLKEVRQNLVLPYHILLKHYQTYQ